MGLCEGCSSLQGRLVKLGLTDNSSRNLVSGQPIISSVWNSLGEGGASSNTMDSLEGREQAKAGIGASENSPLSNSSLVLDRTSGPTSMKTHFCDEWAPISEAWWGWPWAWDFWERPDQHCQVPYSLLSPQIRNSRHEQNHQYPHCPVTAPELGPLGSNQEQEWQLRSVTYVVYRPRDVGMKGLVYTGVYWGSNDQNRQRLHFWAGRHLEDSPASGHTLPPRPAHTPGSWTASWILIVLNAW